jgi:clorobiocin biosynthesis protein CloN4
VNEEGELMVVGPTVMLGYWGKPGQSHKPYATGDLVRLQEDGNYLYLGRRDQMVKVRGYRIELGAIETVLASLDGIQEVAVVVAGNGLDARLVAFAVLTDNRQLSLLDLKRHCATYLPRYMIVDTLRVLPYLPRTRNGKVDRLALATLEKNDTTLY